MASTPAELFDAIEAGDVERVQTILASEPALALRRDGEGVSALMRARYRFDRAMVDAVRAAVPEFDVFEAASFGDLDRLTQLVEEDPSLANARSGDGFTALHLPAFFGQVEAVRLLLERGAEVDARGTGWMIGTALHSAVSGRHPDAARALLEAGADPNARQAEGWTPLHSAVANADATTARLLLAHRADATATNEGGRSVLDLAREGGGEEVIEMVRGALEA